jgi:hypothetical protein
LEKTNKLGLAIAIIAVVGVMTSLSATQVQVQAKKHHSDDSRAFNRGAADAAKCAADNCDNMYITSPGKGFGDHSPEFNHNYIKGFCAAGGGGSDADQATFDCPN